MPPAFSIVSTSRSRLPDWSFAWSWLLGFALTVFLGLSGGGYDPLVGGQVGIAIWWLVLLAVLVGAVPRRRPGPLACWALGLLAAFVLWTALSLRWTESTEKTAADLAQVASFLGIFALALLSRGRDGARQTVSALAAGICVVAGVALLSRLHPAWFPAASETGRFLASGRERLSYPLDYWNALGALIAIGLPLMLEVAADARRAAVRAVAAATLPALILTLYLTLSRGSIAAAAIALGVYLALADDRIPKFLIAVVAGIGGGILILLVHRRYELVHGLVNLPAARSQGDEMIWLTLAVCLVVGLVIAAATRERRPRWLVVSRRQSLVALTVGAVAVLVALLAVNAPHRLDNAWHDFKQPSTESVSGTSRLSSVGGENRYQLWSSAVREFEDEPIAGTGSGTFQFWWTRDGDISTPIIDAHSLYLQTLGELGIVGFLLLIGFVGTTLAGGTVRLLRARASRRSWLAAALAGSTVLWVTSIFDWGWKLPILPIATLLLTALVVTAGDPEPDAEPGLPWPLRGAVATISVLALIAIAIPLAGSSLIRSSQENAREGDSAAALADARSAQNVQPGAATPRLQEALLLEGEARYAEAEAAARAATEREPTNWRTWLVLSRIQAENERPRAALRSYRAARSLNPGSPMFPGP